MHRIPLVASLVAALALCVDRTAAAQTTPPADGWVVLPIDEYRALRDRALPPAPVPPTPPVEATLTRVDYQLRGVGEAIEGRAILTLDVLRDGWTRVQIPAGLMAREARLEGQPVALLGGQAPYVLLSRAGRSLLTLDVIIPLTSATGAESIALPASPSSIARATLVLPRIGVDLTTADGFIADRTETSGESRWTVFGRPGQPLTLSWKRKIDDRRAEQPLRIRGRVSQLVGLGEDTAQVSASVRVEVLQGLAREVVLALPLGFAVNQVDGAAVADWDAAAGTLRVRLLEPVATEAAFVVQGEARSPREGKVSVPLIRIPAAERESGGVAVDVVGAGEIGGRQPIGVEPTDTSDLREVVAGRESPSMLAFRFRPQPGSDNRSLEVTVVRYTPQAVLIANVEEARYRALVSEDGRVLVEARYALRNNQRSFLKIALPPQSTLWSAEVSGRPIRPGVAEANALLLPLEKGRAGEEAPTFAVSVVYIQRVDSWGDKGVATLVLPGLDLPVSRTGVSLHYSPRFKVVPQAGAFRLDVDAGPFSGVLQAPSPAAPPALVMAKAANERAAAGLQTLADRFREDAGGRTVVGVLPVHVDVPAFGPVVFLASELTAEGSAPSLALAFKRVTK